MKWLYLILAVATLPLGLVHVVGVLGAVLGWWHASSQTLYESALWALVSSMLCGVFALRWRSLAHRPGGRGFPLDSTEPPR